MFLRACRTTSKYVFALALLSRQVFARRWGGWRGELCRIATRFLAVAVTGTQWHAGVFHFAQTSVSECRAAIIPQQLPGARFSP
jgi:hypothetical protein